MPETPARAPAPQNNQDTAVIEDILQATEWIPSAEAQNAQDCASVRVLLPNLPTQDLEDVLKSLRDTGTLDRALALTADPASWTRARDAFVAQVSATAKQREGRQPLRIDGWVGTFIAAQEAATAFGVRENASNGADARNMDERADRAMERAKDVQAFDALLRKHPEILGRLKAQGIDLDAEKDRERERLKSENPGMPEAEASARSAISVYLRHADAIRDAAPHESARKDLGAGLERLKPHARELAIPYVEAIRSTAGILPADKAAIVAATNSTGFDTRAVRKGNELRFESPSDSVAQVWSVKPGERPEKSVEIPNGPRIRIATVPEPDVAIARQRSLAIADVETVTWWEGVRTPEGLKTARERFPKALEASLNDALDAPNAWRAFVLAYAESGTEEGKILVAAMGSRISTVSDSGLRKTMLAALDAVAGNGDEFGDHRAELLGEIGKKHAEAIGSAAAELKAGTQKKSEAFSNAVRRIDDADARENGAMLGFQQRVSRAEAVARDNLRYLEENGFLSLGAHFEDFLTALNSNRDAVFPQAEADVVLPKELTEKDRALMARGLVKAVGGTAVEDYFEVPGYKIKRADASGADVMARLRSGFANGVLKDGTIRMWALKSMLRGGTSA